MKGTISDKDYCDNYRGVQMVIEEGGVGWLTDEFDGYYYKLCAGKGRKIYRKYRM